MKRISLNRVVKVTALVLLSVCFSLLTVGCQARAQKMTPECYEVAKQLPISVSVNESTIKVNSYQGVADTELNPRWGAGISSTEFTWALTDALTQSNVFQELTAGDAADYVLDVTILDYNSPWYGSSMTVRLDAKWKLSDAKTKQVVWSDRFATAHKTGWITSIGSITDRGRLQQAQESAARANIKEGIKRLSTLDM